MFFTSSLASLLRGMDFVKLRFSETDCADSGYASNNMKHVIKMFLNLIMIVIARFNFRIKTKMKPECYTPVLNYFILPRKGRIMKTTANVRMLITLAIYSR